MISIYLFLIIYAVNMHNVNQVTYYIEIYFKRIFMDENSLFTPFDEITQTRELQMLKTIIPYMPHDSQKQMTLMVHYISLMNSMRMIDSAPALSVAETESMSDRRLSMLNALKKYCSKSEQDTIDNLFKYFFSFGQ